MSEPYRLVIKKKNADYDDPYAMELTYWYPGTGEIKLLCSNRVAAAISRIDGLIRDDTKRKIREALGI